MISQVILKNLIRNEVYCRKVLPYVLDEYFFVESERIVFGIIRDYIHKYNLIPNTQVINLEVFEKPNINEHIKKECKTLVDSFDDVVADLQYISDITEKFCQDRAIELGIHKSLEILENKDKKLDKGAIPGILADALGVSFDSHVGHDFLDDWQKRFDFYHATEERVPFDIDFLNKITGGGLPRKTLNIILGGVGVGKSLVMCHMAAANLRLGKNVLYLTMEMAEERIAERIDANLLDVPIGQLKVLSQPMYENKINKLKEKLVGKLIIKEYPTASAGADNFRFLLNELKLKKRFVPDVIYVDYLNICKSSRVRYSSTVNTYLYAMMIAQELRGLAIEQNVPIITGTQLNRAGFTDSDPGMEHTSESFGVPAQADLLLVITSNEELAGLGHLAWKQIKNRYNDPNMFMRFHTGVKRDKMQLYNLDQPLPVQQNQGPIAVPDIPIMDISNKFTKEAFKEFS